MPSSPRQDHVLIHAPYKAPSALALPLVWGHKTLGNCYTTILNAYGNPIKNYGDFDVSLKIDQEGAIP